MTSSHSHTSATGERHDLPSPEIATTPEPAVKRVKRLSLANQITAALREAIVRGELKPGERLVEMEIAQQMGTSQAPVREALQRLERDGLVERQSGTATYVAEISFDEMYEIALVRTTVEGLAIRHTAECISPAQCDELDSLVQQMHEAALANKMVELSSYDMEFHRRICEWSGKKVLLQVWKPIYYQWQRLLIVTHPHAFPDLTEVADMHQRLVDVLRGKDADGAERLMTEHILFIWKRNRIDPALLATPRSMSSS